MPLYIQRRLAKNKHTTIDHYLLEANLTRLFEIFYKVNKDKYQWEFWNRQTKPETYKDQRIIAFILFSSYLQNQFELYVNRTYFQALKTRLIPSRLNKPSIILEFLRNQVTLEHSNPLLKELTRENNSFDPRLDEEDEDEEDEKEDPYTQKKDLKPETICFLP